MLQKDKSNPENKAFWDYIEKTAEKVRRWTAWKRGKLNENPEGEKNENPIKC